jgi:hypothetical protein
LTRSCRVADIGKIAAEAVEDDVEDETSVGKQMM